MSKSYSSPSDEPKIKWSDLYGCYICIYMDQQTEKWTIEKCGSKEDAETFASTVFGQQTLPWYLLN